MLLEENLEVVHALGQVTSEKEDVAKTLTRIFELKNHAISLLISTTSKEIDETGFSFTPSFIPFMCGKRELTG